MTSIITGDIINSRRASSKSWMENLKKFLGSKGKNPSEWEIFRGDEFQLEVKNPEAALLTALHIKTWLKTIKLDARISIGIGEKDFNGKKISESNGSAFIRSGELFETLKKQKITLAVNSGHAHFDEEINLMLRLASPFISNWLPQSAEFVLTAIENPGLSQEEIGLKLGINQAAVSRRQKRAHYELLMDLEKFYRQKLQKTLL